MDLDVLFVIVTNFGENKMSNINDFVIEDGALKKDNACRKYKSFILA